MILFQCSRTTPISLVAMRALRFFLLFIIYSQAYSIRRVLHSSRFHICAYTSFPIGFFFSGGCKTLNRERERERQKGVYVVFKKRHL